MTEQEIEIRIEWLEACTYHGFDGSLAEYTEGLEDEHKD
jgi:hypothetical protein